MKIIDLLNKIANSEEVPKKIKYKNKIYEWKEYEVCYGKIMTKKGWVKELGYVAEENRTYFYLKHCYQDLNDEVEIIEEEKKIPEKLDVELLGQCDNWLRYGTTEEIIKDNELNPYIIENIRNNTLTFQHKINEIIDYLKSKGE